MSWVIAASEGEGGNVLALPLYEIIIALLCFFIVFGALAKFALPNIKKTLDESADAIEGNIKRAEEQQAAAEALMSDYQAQLAEAREEAAAIRAQAQADRSSIIEEARSEATAAAAAVTARAEAQIATERAQTISSLRNEVGTLAVTLAGKVVGESLTDEARAKATVDRFIAELVAEADAAGATK